MTAWALRQQVVGEYAAFVRDSVERRILAEQRAENDQPEARPLTPPSQHHWLYLDFARQRYDGDGTFILNPRDTTITNVFLADMDWIREFFSYHADWHAEHDRLKPRKPKQPHG